MSSTETFKVISFIRGYHAYMDIWVPSVEEEHDLRREPSNKEDSNAVAVVRESLHEMEENLSLRSVQRAMRRRDMSTEKRYSHPNEMREDFEIIGHVPKLMAIWLTKFLKRAANSGKAVIKGKRVNRGGGYGLEIPCEFHFTGDAFSISWLKAKLKKEGFDAK